MARGPGKYDDACTVARHMTVGRVCVLIVVDGVKGSGFAVQIEALSESDNNRYLKGLPAMLRGIATQIEES